MDTAVNSTLGVMNWWAVVPQAVLLAATCGVALADLWVKHEGRLPTYLLTQASLAIVAVLHLMQFNDNTTLYAMQRMMVADPLGNLLGFFATVAVMVTLAYARPYAASRDLLKGELYSLSMFALLGILVMLSANNFLVIYLGLELMSLSLYALVALRRDHPPATEAAMKYFVLGALASGFLLYGLSMMYGATGSLDIPEVFNAIATGQINKSVLIFGTVFIAAGLGFKLGAVPFHMWVPDVYQGAPTAITLMIGGAPKLAAFAITFRLLVEGMLGLAFDWQQMLLVMAVASLILGNLAAIAQANVKRMLAYSTIAQMGFVLLGMGAGVVHGNTLSAANAYISSMFYVVAYVMTTLGSFGVLMLISKDGFEAEQVSDLAGLAKRSPLVAAVMAIFMFSLAGIPPMVGFYAKISVLQALISTNVTAYLILAVVAVLISLVGAFYYLRVVKVMYFDEPVDASPIVTTTEARTIMSLNGAAVILFGLLPGGLMALCAQAILQAVAT
jgi:NADH-quinone oxidoreductase subunit N